MCAYPPWPPFVRGAMAARWRTLTEERVLRVRLPPVAPLRKGGEGLRAGGRLLRGEYFVCAYPPWPPFVRGAMAARWRTLTEERVLRVRLPPVAPLRKGGDGLRWRALTEGRVLRVPPTPRGPPS